MTSMKKSEFFHHVLLFDPSMDVHVRWSILFLSFLLTENVVLLAGLGMRAYFDLILYRQGSLPDTESWHFRLCGCGPTLAFRGAITASSATEKRRLEGVPVSCGFNSQASHALASSACENARDSSH